MARLYLSWPPPSWSGQGHDNGDTVPVIGAAKTDLFTYWERTITMTNLSTRWITFTAFLLVIVTLALFMLRHASAVGAPRVQYRVVQSLPQDNNTRLEQELSMYGQEGWELVLVDIGNVTKPVPRYIFKRVEQP
jgi:hypothetical protein